MDKIQSDIGVTMKNVFPFDSRYFSHILLLECTLNRILSALDYGSNSLHWPMTKWMVSRCRRPNVYISF
jgi:hypothetical protein